MQTTKQGVIMLLDLKAKQTTLYKIGSYDSLQPLYNELLPLYVGVNAKLAKTYNKQVEQLETHILLIDLSSIGLDEDQQIAVQTYILNHTLSTRVFNFVHAIYKQDTAKINETLQNLLD